MQYQCYVFGFITLCAIDDTHDECECRYLKYILFSSYIHFKHNWKIMSIKLYQFLVLILFNLPDFDLWRIFLMAIFVLYLYKSSDSGFLTFLWYFKWIDWMGFIWTILGLWFLNAVLGVEGGKSLAIFEL